MSENKACCICRDPEDNDNQIIKCGQCDVQVHVLCYGLENIDHFLCSPCNANAGVVRCGICEKPGGAMKKTTDNRWVHVLCTFFTADSRFIDTDTMEPIDITGVKPSKKKSPCVFCSEFCGTFKCCQSSCKKALHAPCGLENNTLLEVVNRDNTIASLGYCDAHATIQIASKKRLSSENLNAAIRLKTNKQKTAQANKDNSDWILKKTTDNVAKISDEHGDGPIVDDGDENTAHDLPNQNLSVIILDDTLKNNDIVSCVVENSTPKSDSAIKSNLNEANESIHNSTAPSINDSTELKSIESPEVKMNISDTSQESTKDANSLSDFSKYDADAHTNADEDMTRSNSLMNESNYLPSSSNHECYKDSVIKKLQFENQSLKIELNALNFLNSELKVQIKEKLISAKDPSVATMSKEKTPPRTEIAQQPSVLTSQTNAPDQQQETQQAQQADGLIPVEKPQTDPPVEAQDQLNLLRREENGNVIYGDCVRISKMNDEILNKMKTNASDDRKFVNSLFDATFENTQWNTMFPSEKNDKKKVKDKFATTAEYAVIKGLYEKRVVQDETRMKSFKQYINKKIDNKIDYNVKKEKKSNEKKEATGKTEETLGQNEQKVEETKKKGNRKRREC